MDVIVPTLTSATPRVLFEKAFVSKLETMRLEGRLRSTSDRVADALEDFRPRRDRDVRLCLFIFSVPFWWTTRAAIEFEGRNFEIAVPCYLACSPRG